MNKPFLFTQAQYTSQAMCATLWRMAIEFLRTNLIRRHYGHSAVKAAAYRAGAKLHDERTGETHDYSQREDVVYSSVALPEGADERFKDIEFFWNELERTEKRKDAQLGKDVQLALPKELNREQQIELVNLFVYDHFVSKGLPCQINLHDHGNGNPHAHLFMPFRRIEGARFTHKARDLNPNFHQGRIEKQYLNKTWRAFQNHFFQQKGLDIRVDANHMKAQRHEGRIRDEQQHYLKQDNERRRIESQQIAADNPVAVINHLSQQFSVFDERGIATLLHKTGLAGNDFTVALVKVKQHPDLIALGQGENGRIRYTTRLNFTREAQLAINADSLKQRKNHRVTSAKARHMAKYMNLNKGQTAALKHLVMGGDMACVVGRAGTGKTSYLLKAANRLWQEQGYRVIGIAPTGRAVTGMQSEAGIRSYTLHAFLEYVNQVPHAINDKTILVMDEAGMVNTHQMHDVARIAMQAGAKWVAVGDPDQLQAVSGGSPFRALMERLGFVELDTIVRQQHANHREATAHLAKGDVATALDIYSRDEAIHFHETDTLTQDALLNQWQQRVSTDGLDSSLILTTTRRDMATLNQQAHQRLQQHGYLNGDVHTLKSSQGTLELQAGERLLFLQNDKSLGVNNGELGTLTTITHDTLQVRLDNGKTIMFTPNTYTHVDYGYAMTVHKAQGATTKHALIYAAGHFWDRFLTYVALSRHKETVSVFVNQRDCKNMSALKQRLGRHVLVDTVLGWPLSYALRRGFLPEAMARKFVQHLGVKEKLQNVWHFIRDYEGYQQKLAHQKAFKHLAKQAAWYADINRAIGNRWQRLREQLAPHEKPFEHPEYVAIQKMQHHQHRLASTLLHALNEHPELNAVFDYNRINKDTLNRHARQHQYDAFVKRYTQETRPMHRAKMAAYLAMNLKPYHSALSMQGIKPWDLTIEARRYNYINTLATLTPEQQTIYRLLERYHEQQQRLRDFGYEHRHALNAQEKQALYQLREQRNRTAGDIIEQTYLFKETGLLTRCNIDTKRLAQHANSHVAHQKVHAYVKATSPTERAALAQAILTDKRTYNHVYAKNIPWAQLREDASRAEQRQQATPHPAPRLSSKQWDANHVNDTLITMGATFYKTVLGEQGKRQGQQLRFGRKGSFSVALAGQHEGHWYSFETGTGGTPLSLLMDSTYGHGLAFKDALEQGAHIAGLCESDKTIHYQRPEKPLAVILKEKQQEERKRQTTQKNIRYYLQTSIPITGTLAETYLRETRGIKGNLSQFRYHPRVRDERTDKITQEKQVSYHPAVILPGVNAQGQSVCLQTILLNPQTANKVDEHSVGVVKRSRGSIKGSGGLVQCGNSHHVLIVEGPETAASLMQAAPDANIYVTFGNIHNAASLGWLAQKHGTKTFTFIMDKDRNDNNINSVKAVARTLQEQNGIHSQWVFPALDKDKYDFNDVLLEKGVNEIKRQLQRVVSVLEQERHPMAKQTLSQTPNLDKNRSSNPPSIPNWFDKAYDAEWNTLKTIKHDTIELMVKAHTIGQKKPASQPRLQQTINDLAHSIERRPKTKALLQQQAPMLANALSVYVKLRQHEKARGRDR